MQAIELYSERRKHTEGGSAPEVYEYDEISSKLRNQITHIWLRTLGDVYHPGGLEEHRIEIQRRYESIVIPLREEYGLHMLALKKARTGYGDNFQEELIKFLETAPTADEVMDVVELAFQQIESIDKIPWKATGESIALLNERFRKNTVGYQYSGGKIVRLDSTFMHSEAVLPALNILSDIRFEGPNEEFLNAHRHYRNEDFEAALSECLKALESTMKVILDGKGWKYSSKSTASNLIDVCMENNLLDSYWQSQLSALPAMLKSGVPTGRNKTAGHGQGAIIRVVPRHVVEFMINMTASNIVFLAAADEAHS